MGDIECSVEEGVRIRPSPDQAESGEGHMDGCQEFISLGLWAGNGRSTPVIYFLSLSLSLCARCRYSKCLVVGHDKAYARERIKEKEKRKKKKGKKKLNPWAYAAVHVFKHTEEKFI